MLRDKARPQRIRLFQNDKLEQFTLISPVAFILVWSVFLACALYASWGVTSLAMSTALFLLGMLIWSMFEYSMHRFLFHLKTESPLVRTLIFLTHGNHHADPNDPMRNIMPPLVSVIVAGLVWAVFYLVLGPVGSVLFLGFGVGYVIYDSIHYACHQIPMRGSVMRALHRHHMRHHYAKVEGNYAITAIFWDWVFGTAIEIKKQR